jgi:hypothetical protein
MREGSAESRVGTAQNEGDLLRGENPLFCFDGMKSTAEADAENPEQYEDEERYAHEPKENVQDAVFHGNLQK